MMALSDEPGGCRVLFNAVFSLNFEWSWTNICVPGKCFLIRVQLLFNKHFILARLLLDECALASLVCSLCAFHAS